MFVFHTGRETHPRPVGPNWLSVEEHVDTYWAYTSFLRNGHLKLFGVG